jgi:N-acyl-D-aspartate/D-glutamate deacylase
MVRQTFAADLALFDSQAITNQATYEQPERTATGIHMVVVYRRIVPVHREAGGKRHRRWSVRICS